MRSTPSNRRIDHIEMVVAILAAIAFVVLLAVRGLSAGGLWRDEAGAVQLARMGTFKEIGLLYPFESFPMLFPITLRTFTAFTGTTDGALRTFGLLVGLSLIPISFFNCRAWKSGPPLFLLPLVGFNTAFLMWGTSVRGYGIGSMLLLLTIGLAARALSRPTKLISAALLTSALASTHLLLNNLPLLAAMTISAAIVLVLRRRRRDASVALLIGVVCGASAVPYLVRYSTADWNVLLKYPVGIGGLLSQLTIALGEPVILMPWIWIATITGALISGMLVVVRQWHSETTGETDAKAFAFLSLLFGVGFYYLFLRGVNYPTQPWYYLTLVVFIAGLLDPLLALRPPASIYRACRIGFAVAALCLLPVAGWSRVRVRNTNIDLVAEFLKQNAAASDLVVVNPWYLGVSFQRYYQGHAAWMTVPDFPFHRVHRFDLMKSKMSQQTPLADLYSRMQSTLERGSRVWLVGGAHVPEPDARSANIGPAPDPQFGWSSDAYLTVWS